jgi:hypothetical protein
MPRSAASIKTADHFTVPTAAIEEVVAWLVVLRQ